MTDSSPLRLDSIVARLERPLIGERQMGLDAVSEGLWVRNDRKVMEPAPRLFRGPRWELKSRNIEVRVRPEPNAPQLIRLVRHPYAHDIARPQRVSGREARERLTVPPPMVNAMRAAGAEKPVIAPHNPVRDRLLPRVARRPWELRVTGEESP